MNDSRMVQPRISVLTPDQIAQIHAYSLRILGDVGVRVDSARAREVLARAGGGTWAGPDRVRLAPELVVWAIERAPATVEIYDRQGKLAFCLGNDRTRFGIGVTSLYYQDPLSDEVVPFARKHMQDIVRLGNALPLYDVVSTIGIIQDVPPALADLYAVLEMVANTVKPLVILVSDERAFPDVVGLLEHLHGDLAARPFVIPYFNPVTPLIINEGTGDKVLEAVERGLPLIYSSYSMAGASAPITPAGTMALQNAELLAGLVLCQLAHPGAPVILGSLPNYFDMRTMVSFYDPPSMVMNLACAEMMAHYGLPHCGTSGSGTGWGPDLLAAETYWMNQLSSCLGKVGLCPFIGDTQNSKAFAPANVVYVHEVIEQALRFVAGFPLDDAAVDLAEIARLGPGGNYLASRQTLRLFRQAYLESAFFPRWTMEKWLAEGRPRADELLRRHTAHLLETVGAPEDHDDLHKRGKSWIMARGRKE